MTAAAQIATTTGHVGINVTDLDRSLSFYRAVFGWEVLGEGRDPQRRWAFLGRDGQLVLTLWQQSTGTFEAGRPGLHHLSFQVPSMAEVESAIELLRELDVPLLYDGVVPHMEGMSSGGIFFADPDGTRLEIFTAAGAEGAALPHGEPSCGFF